MSMNIPQPRRKGSVWAVGTPNSVIQGGFHHGPFPSAPRAAVLASEGDVLIEMAPSGKHISWHRLTVEGFVPMAGIADMAEDKPHLFTITLDCVARNAGDARVLALASLEDLMNAIENGDLRVSMRRTVPVPNPQSTAFDPPEDPPGFEDP